MFDIIHQMMNMINDYILQCQWENCRRWPLHVHWPQWPPCHVHNGCTRTECKQQIKSILIVTTFRKYYYLLWLLLLTAWMTELNGVSPTPHTNDYDVWSAISYVDVIFPICCLLKRISNEFVTMMMQNVMLRTRAVAIWDMYRNERYECIACY